MFYLLFNTYKTQHCSRKKFYAGKDLDNTNYSAAIAGAISGAFHVRTLAEQYGVPVILHTDHCAKGLLPWVDGLIAASERYFASHGEPLFSSHMIDLSEEPLEENLEICQDYLSRMSKIGLLLEIVLEDVLVLGVRVVLVALLVFLLTISDIASYLYS